LLATGAARTYTGRMVQDHDLASRLRSRRRDLASRLRRRGAGAGAGRQSREWLDHATVAKLKALRGPGDTYSDVILALAEAHAGR
jgi:hypothetical protein